ncbi:TIGR02281 family clan AA aspartic protease [Uliginosibacterium sp. sgz301328]|uniref:retropepsin-like aspartic protease family protein n=1 Tax=Uliginosibacterium sp. sgz301328 TaxID=3243764 RepID=UPI00359E20FC
MLAVCAIVGALSGAAHATGVALVGLFPGKAVLVIDARAPRTLAVGQSAWGVKLLAIGADSATVEVDGQRQNIALGGQPVQIADTASGAGEQNVTLVADGRGHFLTAGSINGASVNFFVDTGASTVAMGPSVARAAGIDYRSGQQGMANTANGTVQTWRVRLNTVTVGGITLHDVEGMVLQADMPYVLLGASFLNRTNMRRDGATMTLTRRF